MTKVISLVHQKGGVGKSTLTFNLAHSFKTHLHTAVVDLDPQGTLSQLKPLSKDLEIIPWSFENKQLPDSFEVLFVDTPPYLSADLPNLFQLSDLVIIPTKAGIADLMAIRSTISMVRTAQKTKPQLKAGIVLNMVKSNSSMSEEVKQMLIEYNVPIFLQMITDRVSFTRSLVIENGIFGLEDLRAKEEMDKLTEEVLNLMNT